MVAGRGKGRRGSCTPGDTAQGQHLEGAKIWNSENASGKLTGICIAEWVGSKNKLLFSICIVVHLCDFVYSLISE